MESKQSALILKIGLWLVFALDTIYGLQLLLVPAMYAAATIGGTPPQFGWVRWAGGMLCGLAFGTLMVVRRTRRAGHLLW